MLFSWDFNSEKDDSQPAPVQDLFFSFGEEVEEGITDSFGSGGGQGLSFVLCEAEFGLFDGFFLGDELVSSEYLGFGVVSLSGGGVTSSLSCLASSMSPRYIISSLVMCESRYSS